MKPYYEDEYATLYLGDALEVLPTIEPVALTTLEGRRSVGVELVEKYAATAADRLVFAAEVARRADEL